MTDSTERDADVLFEERGVLGVITLNRPKAINALTHEMVVAIAAKLDEWEERHSIRTIALTGAGERGLCAGGDIVSLYEDAVSGDTAASERFWRDEYHLNSRIADYPKPFVAIQDGIVLGGGIGLSGHASHRIVTERSKLGMPEVGIGFMPDVGGTWLLSRAPGELGTHLALTGGMMDAGDAIALGFADTFVPAEALPALLRALENTDADEAIRGHAADAPPAELAVHRDWIDDAYSADTVGEILDRLRAASDPAAQEAADRIETKSPMALAVTLEGLRRTRRLGSLDEALTQEFRVSLRALAAADFAEGVRAQVIDKDRNPRWSPAGIDDVTATEVEAYFAPLIADATAQGELFDTSRT